MDYLELQTRANLIVDKVNAYEAQLSKQSVNESEILSQHKYADLFSLRPVLKLLLGETLTKKLNREQENNMNFPVYASSAPMWNTKFGFFDSIESKSFIQPVLTSNGTLGGDSFAVACSSNYTSDSDAFNATNPAVGRWQMYNGQSFPQYLIYYNPTPFNISSISFNCLNVDQYTFFPFDYSLYGSNDGNNWTLIEKSTMANKGITMNVINNMMASGFEYSIDIKSYNEEYKYYKFQVNSTMQSGVCQIGYMRLNASAEIGQLIPSITKHGDVTISSDLIVSNFSTNNYLSMPTLDNVAKEFYIKIKLPSAESSSSFHIFQCDAQCYIMFRLGYFYLLNFGTSSWTTVSSSASWGSVAFIRVQIDGTSVTVDINGSTQTWTDTGIKVSPDSRPTLFGKGADGYPFTNGYIYLADSYYIDSNGNKNKYYEDISQSVSFTQDRHEFMNSLDVYNNNNLIMLDQKQSLLTNRDTRIKQGINYAYGSNIKDALVTESQIANIFTWNTTDNRDIKNNIQTTHRQVPGIVMYYLGNGYDNSFTATIGCNVSDSLNSVQYSHPVSYGSWYVDIDDWKEEKSTSQLPWLPEEKGSCCRIFIPGCSYTRGKLESPQQIWQPDRNFYKGIKYQGKAIYHELVFKNRRSGCTDYNLDFDSGLTSIPDNDPQGLATRLALAKNKEFYYNRPWFNELDRENKFDTSALADELVKPEEEKEISYILDTTNCIFDDEYSDGGYTFDPSTGNITQNSEKSYFNFLIQNRTTQPFTVQTGIVAFSLWSSSTVDSKSFGVCYNGTNYFSTSFNNSSSDLTVQYNQSTLLQVDKTTIDNVVLVMEFTPTSTKIIAYGLKNGAIVSTGATYTDSQSRTEQYLIDFRPYQVDKNLIYGFADLDIEFPTSIEGQTIKNGQMILKGSEETDIVIYDIAQKNEEIKAKQLTDSEFYNNYRLDWETYAKVFNQPR